MTEFCDYTKQKLIRNWRCSKCDGYKEIKDVILFLNIPTFNLINQSTLHPLYQEAGGGGECTPISITENQQELTHTTHNEKIDK